MLLIDATLVSQSGKKIKNTYSSGNRGGNPAKGRRYHKKKIVYKKVHSFTFGLLLTPSGIRIPMQIPHYTDPFSNRAYFAGRPLEEPYDEQADFPADIQQISS